MTQEELDNLIKKLNNYFEQIVEFLFTPDRQGHLHFDDYLFLVKNFNNGNFNNEFKKKYTRFWIVGAMRFNKELKNQYFQLLSNEKIDLYNILATLKEIPPQYLWLSFSTKLIHTIDNNSPMYDSHIAQELPLSKRSGIIERDIKIFGELNNIYSALFNLTDFRDIIDRFREILKEKYEKDHRLISNIKIADSLIWALHNVKNNFKN